MSDVPNPYDFFKIPSQPATLLFDQMAASAQAISQAQARYGEALVRANLAIFAAWLPQLPDSRAWEGPVKASRASEFTQT
jgi:hypothetical protein